MSIFVIVILVALIVVLVLYNISIHKKIEVFSNVSEKITSLNIIQDFMDKVGDAMPSVEKIKGINEILINKYNIPYSTLVMFDGEKYTIRATNTEKIYWETLRNLNEQPIFRDSIQNAVPQKIEEKRDGEYLPYEKKELARAKSAIFFPLYFDNIYVGYWIIEGKTIDEFKKLDLFELEYVKNNIVSAIRAIEPQRIMEAIVREDKFTKLKSEEFLYTAGRRIIDKYATSAVCMFKITNIEQINKKQGRESGNYIISKISELINENMDMEHIFVRYMGPKFAIVFSGKNQDFAGEYMNGKKALIEEIQSVPQKENSIKPKLNVAITTYYKGVALESVAKSLEKYLDSADINENDINFI